MQASRAGDGKRLAVQWWFSSSTGGLDIGFDNVKWAAVEPNRLRSYLEIAPLVADRKSRDDTPNQEELLATLASLHERWSQNTPVWPKQATISVQGKEVACGYLEFPKLSRAELEVAIPGSLAGRMPYSLNDLAVVHRPVPPLNPKADVGVFFTAIGQRRIKTIREFGARLGYEIQNIEPAALALVRECGKNRQLPKDEFVALVHAGFRSTQVVVQRGGNCYYARDFGLAGGDFTHAYQACNQCEWPMAEASKRESNIFENRVSPAESVVLRWLERVRLHLQNFTRSTRQKATQALLSGGSANWTGLAQRLEEHIGIPVMRDSWAQIRPPDRSDADSVLFKVALGLAIR